ncbi:hypothetical protein G9F71_025665 [Clostridium sp. FP2]|uniref:hypothetical protein n=1 Tax=Clostridium sp. FP2 TaxID=2724481 RepID=UPI0013E98E01|nr:hypothetical protein [Clostridium sp. FP2]MBZ9626196.1 hypothetical protein [Clostridium sp. FP2]
MKKHYILIFVPIVISISVIFNGCNNSEVSKNKQSINKDIKEISETYKSIYDNEERIASNSGGAYYSRYAMDMQKKDIISGEMGGYYGASNYWILDAKEAGKITLNYNFEFGKEGKYKLLLCTPDKKLIKIFEHTSGDSTEKNETTIDIAKGVNRVVSIGNNASAKVYISIKTQGDIQIKDFASNK